jgi:hypothetical protein
MQHPELEYHHQRIFQKLVSQKYNSLEIDEMVIDLLEKAMTLLGSAETPENIPDKLKRYHLGTIEKQGIIYWQILKRIFLYNNWHHIAR